MRNVGGFVRTKQKYAALREESPASITDDAEIFAKKYPEDGSFPTFAKMVND